VNTVVGVHLDKLDMVVLGRALVGKVALGNLKKRKMQICFLQKLVQN
jgi:hypothetical protein